MPLRVLIAAVLALGAVLLPASAASAQIPPEPRAPTCLSSYSAVGLAGRGCVTSGPGCEAPELTVPASYVRRSIRTDGPQTVVLVNTLSRWVRPTWVAVDRQSGDIAIAAGRPGRGGLSSDFCLRKPGDYSVVTTLLWYDAASGRLLEVRSRIAEPAGWTSPPRPLSGSRSA